MAETAKQLNRTSCSVTRFKIPDNMFKKNFLGDGAEKMTPTGKLGYALISSLSKKKRPAFLTYVNYHEVLHCSTTTTRKFILQLTESGKIEQDKGNRMYSRYTVLKRPKGKGFIYYDQNYFDIIDKHSKRPVHWTNSVRLIVCRMIRHLISEGKESFVASMNQIANMVGISERAAKYGIAKLLKCKVIFRPKNYKGTREGKSGEYWFGTKLTLALKAYEKQCKEEAKKKVQEKRARAQTANKPADIAEKAQEKPLQPWQENRIAADMRGERERYYSALHNYALDRANKARKKAEKNIDFVWATGRIRECELALARAEATRADNVSAMREALEKAKQARKKALADIGMEESDLFPVYTCKKCSDTGFMKDGRMCDCYHPSRGSP